MGKHNSTDGLESRPYLSWIRKAKQGVLQFEQVTRARFERSEPNGR